MDRSGYPLQDSLRQAGIVNPLFEFPIAGPSEEGWVPATTVFLDNDQALGDLVIAYGTYAWGSGHPHVAGSAFIIAYLTRLVWPVMGQYIMHHRVPLVSLDNIAFNRQGQRISSTGLVRPAFAALPNDPAAGNPDVRLVPDEDALYHQLKEWLFEANLRLVIKALRKAARASIRVSENAVGASCSQVFRELYDRHGDPKRVIREANRFFSDPDSLVYRQVTMEVFEDEGKRGFFSRRAGCCLWWKAQPTNEYCSNCILLSHEEQDAAIRTVLANDG